MGTREDSFGFNPLEGKPVISLEASSLRRGVLNLANIAPAMSFFFSLALISGAAGIGSPLTIVAVAVAIALPGNTHSEHCETGRQASASARSWQTGNSALSRQTQRVVARTKRRGLTQDFLC